MAGGEDSYAVSRRHHLAALAYETTMRGLESRLLGPGGDLLKVTDAKTRRETMVVAVPSSSAGWIYLWGRGGSADTVDPSRAADLVAASLAR
jgi:hypothetical protein